MSELRRSTRVRRRIKTLQEEQAEEAEEAKERRRIMMMQKEAARKETAAKKAAAQKAAARRSTARASTAPKKKVATTRRSAIAPLKPLAPPDRVPCFGNAELFDLTVGDECGKYSDMKEAWAVEYGPFQPVQRFLAEYKMMEGDAATAGSIGADDKSGKRETRLKFVEELSERERWKEQLLFMCMCGYLNGCALPPGAGVAGDQPPSAFDDILAIANAVAARLTARLASRRPPGQEQKPDLTVESVRKQAVALMTEAVGGGQPAPFRLQFVGGNVLLFFAYLADFEQARAARGGAEGYWVDLLSGGQGQPPSFSDIDYTIVRTTPAEFLSIWEAPRAPPATDVQTADIKQMTAEIVAELLNPPRVGRDARPEPVTGSGFLLYRAKTRFCLDHPLAEQAEAIRPDGSPPRSIRRWYARRTGIPAATPQSYQASILEDGQVRRDLDPRTVGDEKRTDPYVVRAWLTYLAKKKEEIARETKVNVYGIAATELGHAAPEYARKLIEGAHEAAAGVTGMPAKIDATLQGLARSQGMNGAAAVQALMGYVRHWVIRSNEVILRWPQTASPALSGWLEVLAGVFAKPVADLKGMYDKREPSQPEITAAGYMRQFYEMTLGDLHNVLTGPEVYGSPMALTPSGGMAIMPSLCSSILSAYLDSSETGTLVEELGEFRRHIAAPSLPPGGMRTVAFAAGRLAGVRSSLRDVPESVSVVAMIVRLTDPSQISVRQRRDLLGNTYSCAVPAQDGGSRRRNGSMRPRKRRRRTRRKRTVRRRRTRRRRS